MGRSLTLALVLSVGVGIGFPRGLAATDEMPGEGYGSWGTFHPYYCDKGEWTCRYWSDAATPSSPTYTECAPLYKWQNGIDVAYRCDTL